MSKYYTPELGQFLHSQSKFSEYKCPDFIKAGLQILSDEIERVEWNTNQVRYDSPIHNNGEVYENKMFSMRAYYWGDTEEVACLPNFSCDGFEVRWYKYLGRGMSMNQEIDANEFFRLIDKCLKYVRSLDAD